MRSEVVAPHFLNPGTSNWGILTILKKSIRLVVVINYLSNGYGIYYRKS
jgi:hypothetical protein